jgi:hypothetical protein
VSREHRGRREEIKIKKLSFGALVFALLCAADPKCKKDIILFLHSAAVVVIYCYTVSVVIRCEMYVVHVKCECELSGV